LGTEEGFQKNYTYCLRKYKISKMRPQPRQKIYRIFFIDFIISLFSIKLKKTNKVYLLERKINQLTKTKNGLALNKGRLGAYLAVKSIITPKKNKIILSPFTIIDLVNMVICAGGIPVFVDVDEKSITIDYKSIKKNYTTDVAGILITHNHKINKDIDKIIEFKNTKNIYLIEDCAISFGSIYNNKFIGTLGDIGFYSFGMFKFVSTLNGGFITTNNDKLYEKFKKELYTFKKPEVLPLIKMFFKALFITFNTHNIIFKKLVSHIIKFGHLKNVNIINKFSKNDPAVKKINFLPEKYKIKISNYQAQSIIKQLDSNIKNKKIRNENASIYYKELSEINELIIPEYIVGTQDSWINFPIQYKNRNDLLSFLFKNDRDIAKYYYRNCNELKIFDQYKKNLPNIKIIVKNLIMLPTYPSYNKKQIYQNIKIIKNYFKKKSK